MTIDEAIELLEKEDRRSYPKRRLEAHLAIKLGREALIKLQDIRARFPILMPDPLPGEDSQ